MLILGIKKVDKFVKQQQELGNFVKWDGWDMVFFRAVPAALYSVDDNGKFNGVWNREANSYGFETRVSPGEDGLWRVDLRNVKRSSKVSRS